jgi:hypothetical protein
MPVDPPDDTGEAPGMSNSDHGVPPPSMDVDAPAVTREWAVDPLFHIVIHKENQCGECRGFRKHLFKHTLDGDEGLKNALEEIQQMRTAKERNAVKIEKLEMELDRRTTDVQALDRDYLAMRDWARTAKEKYASLLERVAQDGQDDERRQKHVCRDRVETRGLDREEGPSSMTESRGSPQPGPSQVSAPIAPPQGTGEDVQMEDPFPQLPCPRDMPEETERPRSFAMVAGLPATVRVGPTGRPSRPPTGAGPTSPSAPLQEGRARAAWPTVQQLMLMRETAHTGGPNSGADLHTVEQMRRWAMAAHAVPFDQRTEAHQWILANWRRSEGIQSTVAHYKERMFPPSMGESSGMRGATGQPVSTSRTAGTGGEDIELPYAPHTPVASPSTSRSQGNSTASPSSVRRPTEASVPGPSTSIVVGSSSGIAYGAQLSGPVMASNLSLQTGVSSRRPEPGIRVPLGLVPVRR